MIWEGRQLRESLAKWSQIWSLFVIRISVLCSFVVSGKLSVVFTLLLPWGIRGDSVITLTLEHHVLQILVERVVIRVRKKLREVTTNSAKPHDLTDATLPLCLVCFVDPSAWEKVPVEEPSVQETLRFCTWCIYLFVVKLFFVFVFVAHALIFAIFFPQLSLQNWKTLWRHHFFLPTVTRHRNIKKHALSLSEKPLLGAPQQETGQPCQGAICVIFLAHVVHF